MVSEVQYGGKITDDLDRRMFKTYTQVKMRTHVTIGVSYLLFSSFFRGLT